MITIVACYHRVKLCTLAARAFWLQQYGGVTRMSRCNLHKKNVRSRQFFVKRRGCCCNLTVSMALTMCNLPETGCALVCALYCWFLPVWSSASLLIGFLMATVYKFSVSAAVRWGKHVTQTCRSSFLSHFGDTIFLLFDAIAVMSFVIPEKKFEQIAFSLSWLKLLR